MQTKLKHLIPELLWLVGLFIISFIITIFGLGWTFTNNAIDIHLHDTYFVLSPLIIAIPLFIFITFLTFFLNGIRNKFSKPATNIIALVSGLTSIILLAILTKQLLKIGLTFSGGWTIYPPLSALPETSARPRPKQFFDTVLNVLILIQILITMCLLFVAYRWGARKYNS